MAPGFGTTDSPIGYTDECTCLRDLIELVEAQEQAQAKRRKDSLNHARSGTKQT